MEPDASVCSQLCVGEWTSRFDLKEAYIHVPIHPLPEVLTAQPTMVCPSSSEGSGLNSPESFYKLLTPAKAYLRRRGILSNGIWTGWSEGSVVTQDNKQPVKSLLSSDP